MSRERTTWNRDTIKAAAMSRQADPYTMNQTRTQPSADAYVTGDPSTFAEDIHPSSNTWKAEYSGDQVKRDEINLPQFRSDTFNHPEKTAHEADTVAKASLAVETARAILPKTASEAQVENQANLFMQMPTAALVDTYRGLVAVAEENAEGEGKTAQDEGQGQEDDQGKQASQEDGQGQVEVKTAQDDEQGQGKQEQEDDQGKQAAEAPSTEAPSTTAAVEPADSKTAQTQEPADSKTAQDQAQEDDQGHGKQALELKAMQDQYAQMQQMMAQMQQMMAQYHATQQPMDMGQQQTADSQMIDQMLAQDEEVMMGDMGLTMEPSTMDMGEMAMTAKEEQQLSQLFFANDQQQIPAEPEQQLRQASASQAPVTRTASTRTVGTRPTAGVSQLGGFAASAGEQGTDLSKLWNSSPDITSAFD